MKKNEKNRYPLYYAIKSLSAENLNTILQPSMKPFDQLDKSSSDYLKNVQYWKIINEKFSEGYNYLHLLINNLTEENYDEISEMIVLMLQHGCSVNSPNDQQETPFYLLLKNPLVENDLINFFVEGSRIDNYSYRGDEITSLMEAKGFNPHVINKMELVVDVYFISQHLGDWDRLLFEEHLSLLQKSSRNFKSDVQILLEEAVIKNLPEIVGILMDYGVDINDVSVKNKMQLTPAFLACSLGHHEVLKVLLNDKKLLFATTKLRRNRGATLLHQIFSFDQIDPEDRHKCFELIISDKRCSLEIVNKEDAVKNVPLHYSCKFGCDDISKELLCRGAYIGHECVMNYIQMDVLEEFLDGRIKCSGDINDKNFEVAIDYKFLTPPDHKMEITAPHLLASNSILRNFILHPAISSFVLLKWKKIHFIVYTNVLIYFGFLLLLGSTIMNFYNVFNDYDINEDYCVALQSRINERFFNIKVTMFDSYSDNNTRWLLENLNEIKMFYERNSFVDKDGGLHNDGAEKLLKITSFMNNEKFRNNFRRYLNDYWPLYYIGMLGIFFMAAYEMVQFKMSWRKYFFKPINWIDLSLIGFSLTVLVGRVGVSPDNFRRTCSVMILLMGAQCIQLFSKVSAFSLSLHLAILGRVSRTFLKTILPYLIIILAFGMSFYALNFQSNNEVAVTSSQDFANTFISTISTVRMMLSDFGAIIVTKHDYFKGTLFLGFMIAISIIVFNLLNALAISDTNEMMEVAELVETSRRISTLRTYDTLFTRFTITFFNMFPNISNIMLTPNVDNVVRIKNKNPFADKVHINVQDVNETPRFRALVPNNYLFWKKQPDPVELDEKVITKILDYVRNREMKRLEEMMKQKNNQDIYALGMALKTLQTDMDYTKSRLELLQNTFDENYKSFSQL